MRCSFKSLLFIWLLLIGCASTAPLPATLNIIPPAPDVLPEVAAFSGIWDGKWEGYYDRALVVENIDNNKANIIYSYGLAEGREPFYWYITAQVSAGASIEWTNTNGDKWILTMDKGLNEIHGVYIEKKTGAKYQGYFHRRVVK